MNTNQGALYFGAGIDLNQWRRDIDSMRRDIAGLNQNVTRETRNMDSAFKNLSIGIASYFSVGAIKSFVMELINVRGEFQKTEIAFSTMLGSAEKAKVLMGDMVNLAANTPFSLQDVSSGAKQLLAFQIPANEVVDTLTRMGNIAAGLGVPLSRINLVYGQVKAKGRLMGDDLRQFTEAGIPMVAELAKKFNKTTAEITDMVTAGKIGFKDVQDVLFSLTNEGGMFFNLMEKQSKSLSGQVANLGDAWDQMLNKIGESQEGLLSDGIQSLIYMVEHYQDVLQILSTLVAAYGAYKAVLITVNALQKAQIWAEGTIAAVRFAQGISGMTRAQLLFNAAASANPYVLLASGIAAVIAALVYFRTASTDAKEEAEKLTAALEYQKMVSDSVAGAYKRSSETIVGSIEKEIAILKSSYSSAEMRKKAYENLTKINKAFVGTVDGEFRATVKLNEAYSVLVSRLKELAIAKGKAALLEELSKKKAQADLDLVLKQDAYEKQRSKNLKLRAENAKKDNIGAGMYRELKLEEGIDYSTYNPVKEAKKAKSLFDKQVEILADDVTKGIVDATKKNDKELKDAWGNIGEAALESGPKKGTEEWYKGEIDRLEALKAKAVVGSKAWNAYRLQIDKYNDLLSPKKDKTDNKQLAEIFPDGSIKDLERKAQLITDALATVENGVVKIRKLDQFGNDKDKKGNALLTGENVSIPEAKSRLVKINEALEAKRKEIEVKSFQERIDEAERQWNNYYKMAEFYGKESADAQYKELFKGSANYLQYLESQEQALKDLQAQGNLTDQQKTDLLFITEKIRNLNGTVTPLEYFKRDIDDTLKSLPSLADKLEYINRLRNEEFVKGNKNPEYLQKNPFLNERADAILQQQKDIYQEFLNEQKTFEDKKTEVEKKYTLIRDQIAKNKSISDAERLRQLNASYKQEGKEITDINLEGIRKTDLWIKSFGDLQVQGIRSLKNLKKGLQDLLSSGKVTEPTEIKAIQDQILKIEETIGSRNPFEAIGNAIDKYKKKREELNAVEKKSGRNTDEYKAKLEDVNQSFVGIIEVVGEAAKAMIEIVGTIGDAFGGLSDELKQTLAEVQQLVEGIVNVVAGYFSGNYGQMISGIVQIVGAMVKLLSGDKGRERDIKKWQNAVDGLKTSYNELQYAIEKTAGEASLSMNRGLIENLEEQKRLLTQMRDEESKKKKSDAGKIASFNDQISQVNQQITDVIDNFKKSITTTEFKELADKLAEALIDGFSRGEDAAISFEKVVDDVMRNAVLNALKIKYLQPLAQEFVDKFYKAMGYGNGNTNANDSKIKDAQEKITKLDKEIKEKESQTYTPYLAKEVLELKKKRQELLDLIGKLNAEMASVPAGGAFDGLSEEEIKMLKDGFKNDPRLQAMLEGIKGIDKIFDATFGAAEGLKGDIKGITEKTAGALEAQFNALRINVVAMFQLMKQNHTVQNAHTVLLSQIEVNTRHLYTIRKDIAELNQKVKKGAAGIP